MFKAGKGSCMSALTASGFVLYPFGYNSVVSSSLKPLHWLGSSKKDLLAMPRDVVDVFGFALNLAQSGKKQDMELIRERLKVALAHAKGA
jgi:hypothetical protein